MIDLHLHLDGSLSIEDYRYLATTHNIQLNDDFPNSIFVSNDCENLNEYLKKFDLPLTLLQDELSLAYATKSLINRLYEKGYIYAEIRFAPQLHTKEGMTQNNAVLAVLSALNSSLKNKPDFDANIILCCMRQGSYEENLETIELANKYKGFKVVSVDLAGPEAYQNGMMYKDLFDRAEEYGLNVIIHAGEECGSDEVMTAINTLHAKRIGHGIHLDLTLNNTKLITQNNISFEFCPTSNLQTKSLSDYCCLPLRQFLSYGINVTINSDNMTISNTDVYEEFKKIIKSHNLQPFEIKQLLLNAADAAFLPIDKKILLKKKIELNFVEFYYKVTNN